MRPSTRLLPVLFVVLSGLALGGCSMLENAGKSFASGAVSGARETLQEPETKTALQDLSNSLGDNIQAQVPKVTGSLDNELKPIAANLREDLLGAETRAKVGQIRDDVLGEKTQADLKQLRDDLIGEVTRAQVVALRNALLGETTRMQIGDLRDELIGEATNTAFKTLIDSTVAALAMSYRKELQPVILASVDSLRAQGEETTTSLFDKIKGVLGYLFAGVALLFLLFFYLKARRERRTLEAVTLEIEQMPDEETKKKLKQSIQTTARQAKVEPHLQKVLEGQGIS